MEQTVKASLFMGHAGHFAQICKMNNVDPLDWRSQTLTRAAHGLPAAEIEALMAWNFRPDPIG